MLTPGNAVLEPHPPRFSGHQLEQQETRKLLESIQIPPQPEIVMALMSARNSEDPDIQKISRLISNDAGIAAAVLKTVNSPFYGLNRKLTSVQQAVSALGMKNIGALVMGLALRNTVPVAGMDEYWETTQRTSEYAVSLARQLGLRNIDEIQLYVLFHDSAMPLLLKRFPDYLVTMKRIPDTPWIQITEMEDSLHNTNHVAVGGLLARSWGLPERIREAIQWHHDLDAFDNASVSNEVRTLIAVGHVADHIQEMTSRHLNECTWEAFGDACLTQLMLGEAELQDFIDSVQTHLEMENR
jgi:HD-like signal output (HDOD) protein